MNMIKTFQCKPTQHKRSLSALRNLLIIIALLPSFANAAKGPDKIRRVDVLQNTFHSTCAYMHDVTMEIEYKLKKKDTADIVISGVDSSGALTEFARKEIEYGKGSVIMDFNAGDCTNDLSISIE